MIDLEIERTHPAHKAFLLALIRSGKVNVENLVKVFIEIKQSGQQIDIECIYCKYSQFALKESAKVGLLQQQQAQQNNDQQMTPQQVAQQTQEFRIEHLIKMFQT